MEGSGEKEEIVEEEDESGRPGMKAGERRCGVDDILYYGGDVGYGKWKNGGSVDGRRRRRRRRATTTTGDAETAGRSGSKVEGRDGDDGKMVAGGGNDRWMRV